MEKLKVILNHEGYWRDENKNYIPQVSGIFFVYESKYKARDQTIKLKRLLYIGESDNVQERICNHPNYKIWKNSLDIYCELSFSFVPVSCIYRLRIESAYISTHKPFLNHHSDFSFDFVDTFIISLGRIGFTEPVIDLKKNTQDILSFDEMG